MKIEDLLYLDEERIRVRMDLERRKIPTIPGLGYLQQRLKRFDTPEWNFLIYLAHNDTFEFGQRLEQYASYDGNESRAAIIEDLREYYILGRLLSEFAKKEPQPTHK